MRVNSIFLIVWEEGIRGIFFSIYEDPTLVKSILRCIMLFHFYDIILRFFFAEIFKTYPCISFIYLKISLYVFELFLEILENLLKYFYYVILISWHYFGSFYTEFLRKLKNSILL